MEEAEKQQIHDLMNWSALRNYFRATNKENITLHINKDVEKIHIKWEFKK